VQVISGGPRHDCAAALQPVDHFIDQRDAGNPGTPIDDEKEAAAHGSGGLA
jgi:hypothetical protein